MSTGSLQLAIPNCADEPDDFQAVVVLQGGGDPVVTLHNLAVEFCRHAN